MVRIPVKTSWDPGGYRMTARSAGPAVSQPPEPVDPAPGISESEVAEPAEPAESAEDPVENPEDRVEELRTAYDRLLADFANYKRHAEADLADAETRGQNQLVRQLVPVLTDLNAAAQAAGNDADGLRRGVRLIRSKLEGLLDQLGYDRIETAGASMDPRIHEAVALVETPQVPQGRILKELAPGYQRDGKLVQPARVVVARGPV